MLQTSLATSIVKTMQNIRDKNTFADIESSIEKEHNTFEIRF